METHQDPTESLRDKSKPIVEAATKSLSSQAVDAMLDTPFDAKMVFEQRSLMAGIDMALTDPTLSPEDREKLWSFQDRLPGYSPETITKLYRDFLKGTQMAQNDEPSPAAILAAVLGTVLILSNRDNGNSSPPPSPPHHRHHHRGEWEEQRRRELEIQRRQEWEEQRRREWEMRQRRIQQEREWRFRHGW